MSSVQLTSRNYIPSPKQRLFHSDKHPVKILICGVGFGKSQALAMELLYNALVKYPKKIGLACAPTYKLLYNGLLEAFKKITPPDLYKFDSTKGIMQFKNGSVVLWRTTNNPNYLRGTNCAYAVFDEASVQRTDHAYNEIMNRLRDTDPTVKTQLSIATTPNGFNWLVDNFGSEPDGAKFFGNKDCWYNDYSIVIRARTFDNPYFPIDSDYVKNQLRRPIASPEWIAQNIYAEFVTREGIVFPEFKQVNNVITGYHTDSEDDESNPLEIGEKILKYYASFDWGFTAPSCLLIFGRTNRNRFILTKEYHLNGLTWDENGWFRIFKEAIEEYELDTIICDHAHPDRIAASNRFFKHRPKFIPCIKKQSEAINRTKKLFIEKRLLIDKDCNQTIKEFQTWAWKKSTDGSFKEAPEAGKDHGIDATLYFIIAIPANEMVKDSFSC